jgi:putative RecB family exonuclease
MSFELPRSLSPSKVTSFRDCALAFRFSAIDHLPEPSSPAMVKGTLVHSALEKLFWLHEQGDRSESVGLTELDAAWDELQSDPEYVSLGLTTDQAAAFLDDGATLVRNYFRLEDPNQVRTVGTELTLDAKLGSVRLRGIIDRLDLTDDGDLVVVDYKTGRAPSEAYEQSKLVGVHIYAMLCEELLGRRPVRVELLHLREPTMITAKPSDQAIRGHRQRTVAVWSAIERACRDEDFRPKTSPLCKHCHFQPFCPAFGGDPALAAPTLLAPPIVHKGAA